MEVPSNVLPDAPQEIQVSDHLVPDEVIETQAVPQPQTEVKGEKTPETNLYSALKEERELRKAAERELKILKTQPTIIPDEDVFSDEGKNLKKHVDTVGSRVQALEEELAREKILSSFPAIRENLTDFEDFKEEYRGFPLDKVAKLFLAEKGLVGSPRKGLERATSGTKVAQSTGISEQDVKRLRETQPRKYEQMLREGKINPNDIN